MPRSDRRRRHDVGILADHPSRRDGTDDGLRAPGLLAADGYAARQDASRAIVGFRKSAVEDLELIASFWRGKRVLVTGHSGFKGSWLTLWLNALGAKVTGISLPPVTTPNLFTEVNISALCDSRFCDIRDRVPFIDQIHAITPQIVFHLAAQPLVRPGYEEPLWTFETNVMGTLHLLEALRDVEAVRVAVMITTDKVYRENARPHREDDVLGGKDPYSASKAACEHVIACYRDSFLAVNGVAVASARAGNVIGGGDWSRDRLIPDAVRAWQEGQTLEVRRPQSVRPWQHVLEPLWGYLTLARKLWQRPTLAGAYNFGPEETDTATAGDVIELARMAYGRGEVRYGDGKSGPHESAWLALDKSKAQALLGVSPEMALVQAVERTMAWYRAHGQGVKARDLCLADIADYQRLVQGASVVAPLASSA
ncbi:MAG: CDP-glucose 4,6-dehydratase [Pseudolabrys sp.]|nr:CDP-glucose 4,6-dehydratase [Pseudolabrys sp.]